MRAKAKKAPMRSVSLLAIELKELTASGKALKNIHFTTRVSQDRLATVSTPAVLECNSDLIKSV